MFYPRGYKDPGKLFNTQGFTLIELMLVVAVLGILTIVTIPKYESVKDHYHLNSAAKKLETQLHYAKQLAMDNRNNIYVVFAPPDLTTFYVINPSSLNPVLLTENLDSGINFDSSSSLGIKSCNELNINGYSGYVGVMYDKQGFTYPVGANVISFAFTSTRSGLSVWVNIKLGTGYITTTWNSPDT